MTGQILIFKLEFSYLDRWDEFKPRFVSSRFTLLIAELIHTTCLSLYILKVCNAFILHEFDAWKFCGLMCRIFLLRKAVSSLKMSSLCFNTQFNRSSFNSRFRYWIIFFNVISVNSLAKSSKYTIDIYFPCLIHWM